MRKKVLHTLLIFLSLQFLFAQQGLTEIENFGENPGNLRMFVYKNLSLNNNSPLPLVLVLHGCGQTAEDIARLTGWNKLADKNEFILIYPQQKVANNINACFNWFKDSDVDKGEGESESIYQMMEYAFKHFTIDKQKIFITGVSAGGAMSIAIAATHPDLINTAAIFAGGPYKLATTPMQGFNSLIGNRELTQKELVEKVREQNESYKIPYCKLIVYQGQHDPIVNPKNAELLIKQWTGLHNADTLADKVEKRFAHVDDITRSEFFNKNGQTVVTFYDINNLGHRLLINPGNNDDQGGETGVFAVDKDFHSTYQTAIDFGLIKNLKVQTDGK